VGVGFFSLLLASIGILLAGGCAHPVSARKGSFHQAYEAANTSVLTSGSYSDATRLVLHRFDLLDRFDKDPDKTLRELHEIACRDERRDLLFALAELNYYHGQNLVRNRLLKPWVPKPARDYFLCSAIYAYQYLFGEATNQPDAFEPQVHFACDIYNVALARAFIVDGNTNGLMEFRSETRSLNPGSVRLDVSQPGFPWDLNSFDAFSSADQYIVHGLTVHNVHGALGATLIAPLKTTNSVNIAPNFPTTLILRVSGGIKQWSAGQTEASLELYAGWERRIIDIGGRQIPLRTDTTTPMAVTLNNSSVWKIGRQQFFSSAELLRSDVYQTQPYERGRVPVVFVHGTFSSPVWWAEMVNTLRADPVVGARCQFWYYIYNSGNPILFTAANFRQAITNMVHRLDPDGTDPALRQMVVIGHSQGGLVAKLAAIDPGNEIWNAVSHRSFSDLELKPKQKEELGRSLFFKPVPWVRRLVFISTPHRGSFLATKFIRNLAAKFMSLPVEIVQARKQLQSLFSNSQLPAELRAIPSSLNGMSPSNPVLLRIAEIPPAPGVVAHSIIAVKGNGDPTQGDDGVVEYTSAHVPYVESELVVRSSHSCQGKPATIEEVRRILLENLKPSGKR
jgi:pimeloyl-ACP methyl ester carboxylesterase